MAAHDHYGLGAAYKSMGVHPTLTGETPHGTVWHAVLHAFLQKEGHASRAHLTPVDGFVHESPLGATQRACTNARSRARRVERAPPGVSE